MKDFLLILMVISFLFMIYILVGFLLLKNKKRSIDESFDRLDIYLKERWSLIPHLINSVKYEMAEEKFLIEEIIILRNANYSVMTKEKKLMLDLKLSSLLKQLEQAIDKTTGVKKETLEIIKDVDIINEKIEESRNDYTKSAKQYDLLKKFFPKFIQCKTI